MKKAIKKLLPLAAVLLAAAMLGGCGAETDKPAGTSGIGLTSETKDTGTEKTTAPLRITCVGDSIYNLRRVRHNAGRKLSICNGRHSRRRLSRRKLRKERRCSH